MMTMAWELWFYCSKWSHDGLYSETERHALVTADWSTEMVITSSPPTLTKFYFDDRCMYRTHVLYYGFSRCEFSTSENLVSTDVTKKTFHAGSGTAHIGCRSSRFISHASSYGFVIRPTTQVFLLEQVIQHTLMQLFHWTPDLDNKESYGLTEIWCRSWKFLFIRGIN